MQQADTTSNPARPRAMQADLISSQVGETVPMINLALARMVMAMCESGGSDIELF